MSLNKHTKHIDCQRHLWNVRTYALLLVFLLSGPFFKVHPLSILKNGPEYLTSGTAQVFTLFFFFLGSSDIVWFWVVFSFPWNILFQFSSPRVWWCQFPVFPSICMFPFFQAFWFCLDLLVLFPPSFSLFIISMTHFLSQIPFLCPTAYSHFLFERFQFFFSNCISHSTNTLGKGMNPIILPPAMGK